MHEIVVQPECEIGPTAPATVQQSGPAGIVLHVVALESKNRLGLCTKELLQKDANDDNVQCMLTPIQNHVLRLVGAVGH